MGSSVRHGVLLLLLTILGQLSLTVEVMAHDFATTGHGHPAPPQGEATLAPIEGHPTPEAVGHQQSQTTLSFSISPAQSAKLLETLGIVGQARQEADIRIRSSVLCFCLTKGPATIREIRQAAEDWFAKGLLAFKSQHYEAAIAAFTKAIQLHPRHVAAYLNRGITFANLHQYQAARADFHQAVNLEPQQPEAYYAAAVMAGRDVPRLRLL